MGMTPDIDDVRDAYVTHRTGELMTPNRKPDDVEAIAEDEFENFIAELRTSILKESKLDPRGNVTTND